MRDGILGLALVGFAAAAVVGARGGASPATALDIARIEKLTGAQGKLDEKEGVFKVSVPRSDLRVVADGVRITPALGLTSWAAFKKAGEQTMVMGDVALSEDQVGPVMSLALDSGLAVTALHNHFLRETPKVMFMHIAGHGEEAQLATAVGKAFAKIKETAGGAGPARDNASIDPANTTLDPKKIQRLLGAKGELKEGVYKVVIGRSARMEGHEVGASMGVNTWAAFAGSDDRAVVAGDFAVLEEELQGVLKALRRAGIEVVAIHQHMSGEAPRLLFLHYWSIGRAEDLAAGVRGALDATGWKPERADLPRAPGLDRAPRDSTARLLPMARTSEGTADRTHALPAERLAGSSAPGGWPSLMGPLILLAATAALMCLLHLWTRQAGGFCRKLLWSVVLLLPVLGLIFYLAFYQIPRRLHPQQRAEPNRYL